MLPTPPTGTVTFLFTDIEGSTRLWEQQPDAMRSALTHHDQILRDAIERQEGYVFKTGGDAFYAVFATASQGLNAALNAQRALFTQEWETDKPIRVRMALHTGTAEDRNGDYFGQPLNRVARLMAAAHGGQTLLSYTTQELVRDSLTQEMLLQNLGEHRLKDLGRPERVFQLTHPSLPSEFPPLRSLTNPGLRHNLPEQVSSFIGREKAVAQVEAMLNKTRLLTLVGMGGTGKTRLSLQVAANLLTGDGDGVWLVELAPLADPALVPQAVADVLGVREESGKPLRETLVESLKEKNLLLVLDNCEHVLASCASLVSQLLRVCPQVKILASSREALGIAGEQAFRLPSLTFPDPKKTQTADTLAQCEAVRLFIERARLVQPTFTVTDDNAPAVAAICHRLDGVPLALELAAARVRSLAVEEINRRLDSRFRLLTGGSRTAQARQQTLRALIDWSYDLLTEQEKAVLARLSVFAGDWSMEAAESVCQGDVPDGESVEEWDVLDLVTTLADKSLLVAEQGQGRTRYRLLETMRHYSADRLVERGDEEAAKRRHGGFFLALAEEAVPQMRGPEQGVWLDRLEAEHDNMRAALAWAEAALDGAETGLRLATAMFRFWRSHGHLSEGRERLAAAVGHAGARDYPLARASALRVASSLAQVQGDLTAARALAEEALALFESTGNSRSGVGALLTLGNVALMQDDLAGARIYYERCLPLYRELGDHGGVAKALDNLGVVMKNQGDLAGAVAVSEESLTHFRAQGDVESTANVLNNLGEVAYLRGEDTEARGRLTESLTLFRQIGTRNGHLVGTLCLLGTVALRQGNTAEARTLMAEGLTVSREIGDGWDGADALETWAKLFLAEGRASGAACLLAAAARARQTLGIPKDAAFRAALETDIAAARTALGDGAFEAAWAKGEKLTWEQAAEYALADPGKYI